MARKDPSLIPPMPVLRETRSFIDSRSPGDSWEFTFQIRHGLPERSFLEEKKKAYAEAYLTGIEQVHIPGADSGTVRMSKSLCDNIAYLQMMDCTRDEMGGPWLFPVWAIFSVQCPDAFLDVLDWAADLTNRATGRNPDSIEPEEISLGNGLTANVASS